MLALGGGRSPLADALGGKSVFNQTAEVGIGAAKKVLHRARIQSAKRTPSASGGLKIKLKTAINKNNSGNTDDNP